MKGHDQLTREPLHAEPNRRAGCVGTAAKTDGAEGHTAAGKHKRRMPIVEAP
jgi:hypothetical protein